MAVIIGFEDFRALRLFRETQKTAQEVCVEAEEWCRRNEMLQNFIDGYEKYFHKLSDRLREQQILLNAQKEVNRRVLAALDSDDPDAILGCRDFVVEAIEKRKSRR